MLVTACTALRREAHQHGQDKDTDQDLGNNQLTGNIPPSIPAQIGNLANLGALDLKGNQLTDSIPSQIGNLANLQFIVLSKN